jgi:hypothetical protein
VIRPSQPAKDAAVGTGRFEKWYWVTLNKIDPGISTERFFFVGGGGGGETKKKTEKRYFPTDANNNNIIQLS